MEVTYARASAVKTASKLKLEKMNIRLGEVTRCERFVMKGGTAIDIISPKKEVENKSDKTVIYCTRAVASSYIEMMSDEDIEEYLGTVMKATTFVRQGWKYGIVKMRFSTKEEAAAHATKILQSEKMT